MKITHQNKIILAGLIGNLVEAFDMATCGLLSVFMAKYLTKDTQTSLLIILSTFFLSFLTRPLGALILGLCSDRYGRKKTLATSITIMGLSTSLIGFIPPYELIGYWSIFFLLSLRIIQSLACGAEFLNSSTYLVESTDIATKGYSGSWASFGSTAGTLLASILLLCMTNSIEHDNTLEWILWRIPLMFALVGTVVGLYVRFHLPESKEYILHYADHKKPMFTDLLKQSFKYMISNRVKSICVFCLSGLGVSITCLIYIFPSMQIHVDNQFSIRQALVSTIISLTVMLCFLPYMGKLTDKMNRSNLIRYAAVMLLVMFYPFFYILHAGTFHMLVFMQACMAIPTAIFSATVPVFLTELFPLNLRCTLLSMIYSIAASLFGGLVPLASLYLIQYTNNPMAPLLIVLGLVFMTIITLNHYKKQTDIWNQGDVIALK
jgi:MHS family proline/betaine transporter-like MFS transporter